MNNEITQAVGAPLERQVGPRFCQDCGHCGSEQHDGDRTKRVCAAATKRRDDHFEMYGKTPDAYWTAPQPWVYINSGHADRCKWFVAA